jgi:hypothetical protein
MEDATNNLQVTDVADTLTTRIGGQLTGGPSDPTERSNATRDLSEGETGQYKTDVKQQETPTNSRPNALRCEYKIVKVTARKAAKPQVLYKAKFRHESAPRWVPVTQIPPEMLADFHVRRFQRRKNRKIKHFYIRLDNKISLIYILCYYFMSSELQIKWQ